MRIDLTCIDVYDQRKAIRAMVSGAAELQRALNESPAANKERCGDFCVRPTGVTGLTFARLNNLCGNLNQITKLAHG